MIDRGSRILLVDLDDTIYDRTPHRFEASLASIPSHRVFEDLAPEALPSAVEAVRSLSPMFEALGYPSTRYRTDRPLLLAGMLLVFGSTPQMADRWRISTAMLASGRKLVGHFQAIVDRDPPETWQGYLAQQLLIRFAAAAPGSDEVRKIIDCLRTDHQIVALAEQTADHAPWESRVGFPELWSRLTDAGVKCYVASEGEEELQGEKLASLGLDSQFERWLLTTERAAAPLDTPGFRTYSDTVFADTANALRVDCAFDAEGRLDPTVEVDLVAKAGPTVWSLAAARWMLSTFAGKTPGYYARILSAVVDSPAAPKQALDSLVRVNADRSSHARVAMFGNNHAKDVVPIQRLLGADRVWTGLLDAGLHRGIKPSDAGHMPSRTFPSWSAAVEGLDLSIWEDIKPLTDVRPQHSAEVLNLLNRGRADSRFEVVGKLADFLAG